MHAMYFLCAGIGLLIIAGVIFGLWMRHKLRDKADQNRQDEQIRLSIIQTEAHAAAEQTRKFEDAMSKKQRQSKKRQRQSRQKAVRTV
jgi:hypothetical protein